MKFHPIFAARIFHYTEKLRIYTEKLRINTEKLHMATRSALGKERLERAARLYSTNKAAEEALGTGTGVFAKACRRHGIETPYQRNRKIGRRYAS